MNLTTVALAQALERMVRAWDDLCNETEGRYPEPDPGCVICTAGVTPKEWDTGLCPYHNAKRALRHAVQQTLQEGLDEVLARAAAREAIATAARASRGSGEG